jgi:hypothetical protein
MKTLEHKKLYKIVENREGVYVTTHIAAESTDEVVDLYKGYPSTALISMESIGTVNIIKERS